MLNRAEKTTCQVVINVIVVIVTLHPHIDCTPVYWYKIKIISLETKVSILSFSPLCLLYLSSFSTHPTLMWYWSRSRHSLDMPFNSQQQGHHPPLSLNKGLNILVKISNIRPQLSFLDLSFMRSLLILIICSIST